MRVITKKKDIYIEQKSILTIGNFDGVHKGHLRIIKRVVKEAKTQKAKSVVLTFVNHPAVFLKKIDPLFLMTKEEKEQFFKSLGVDILIFLKFTQSLSEKAPIEFLNFLKNRIHIAKIIVGSNFYFGKGNIGNVKFLKSHSARLGYAFEDVPLLKDTVSNSMISSSLIRKFVLMGDIPTANRLLGYQYSIASVIVKGKQQGRKIGFPTLNFDVKQIKKIIPSPGVYRTLTLIGRRQYHSLTYISEIGKKQVFETFVMKFNRNIYGKEVRIFFIEFLRKPKKIKNLEKLKHQINLDVEQGGSRNGFN